MKDGYRDRKYTVIPYDPAWVKQFNAAAVALRSVFGTDAVGIEHIGSTAVPGMSGKPSIDILVLVNDVNVVDKYIRQIEGLGYMYKGAYVTEDSRLFHREKDNAILINLHIFPANHRHVKEMLGVRDYFITHPETIKEYSELKLELFKKYPNDYASYRKYKDEWMHKLMIKISDKD